MPANAKLLPLGLVVASLATTASPVRVLDKGDQATVGSAALAPPGVPLGPKDAAVPARDGASARARPQAVCTYDPLTSGIVTAVTTTTDYAFTMGARYWCAVGVRPQAGDDWDLALYPSTAPDPACVAGQVASSTQGTGVLDFIVGDFNYNPFGEYYVRTYPFTATNPAAVEWDDYADIITVNGYGTSRSTGSNDVLECWDVFLYSGVQYTISLGQTGATQADLFLFNNPAGAPTWQPRSSAAVTVAGTANGSTAYYTAPHDGWYGVVVTNENAGAGTYAFRIDTCAPPAALASGVTVPANRAPSPFQYTQVDHFWSAVGVRSQVPNQDWDLFLYRNQAGGPFPGCFSNLIETSTANTNTVDLVVGDFNNNPLGTFFADAIPTGLTNTDGWIEWEAGGDILSVNSPSFVHATGTSDLVTIWDIYFGSGQTYRIDFYPQSPNGTPPDCWVLLFRNHNPGVPYWTERAFADLQTHDPTTYYTAPATGWYGLAVVNDDGGSGQYVLGVFDQNVDALPMPMRWTNRLTAIVPNPARASARFDYELAREARVSFEVVDAAGRVLARTPETVRPAGFSHLDWDRNATGLRSGLYLLRMRADGTAVATSRFVVLD